MADRLAGWVEHEGRLIPDPTVAGALRRHCIFRGSCYVRDECKRTVTLGLEYLISHGYAKAQVEDVQAMYRCRRVPYCLMEWLPRYADGFPVQSFVGGGTKFEVRCQNCSTFGSYTADEIIAALRRSKQGDGNTGIYVLDKRMKRPCKLCGASSWYVDVRHADNGGPNGPPEPPGPKRRNCELSG
jgi:hypothetical protein